MKTPLLLDTCALIWSAMGGDQPKLRQHLRAAYEGSVQIWISPISAWEIGQLVALRRITRRQICQTNCTEIRRIVSSSPQRANMGCVW